MPFQPTHRDVHTDVPLSNISIAYGQVESDYVLSKMTRPQLVNKESGKIAKYPKEYWFRDEAQERAPATETAGSGYTVSYVDYATKEYGIHKDIPDEIRDNEDAPFNTDNDARRWVTSKLLIKRDVLLAADIFTTSVWATDVTGVSGPDNGTTTVTYFSEWGDSNLIDAVERGREGVHAVTGKNVNRGLLGRQVWRYIKHHPQLIDRIKYTQRGQLTTDLVASLLEIERIVIGESIKASAVEGATATYSYIFGKSMLLCYLLDSPSLLEPSAFVSLQWRRSNRLPITIRRLRNDFTQVDRIEGLFNIDHVVTASDCGYFYSAIVP